MSEEITDPRRTELLARISRAKSAAKTRQDDYLRRVILVTHEQTQVDRFGPDPDYFPAKAVESSEPIRLDDVIEEILGRFGGGAVGDSDRREGEEPGYGSRDLCMWQDRRLIAIVRRGPKGQPIVTCLEGVDR